MRKIAFIVTPLVLIAEQSIDIGEVEVSDSKSLNTQTSSYVSSRTITQGKLKAQTKKDGTISDALRSNPNVILNKTADSSTESGEISPKDVSINGASFYQNNFMVDGLNFNDDINPAGYRTLFKNTWRGPTLGSQAINLSSDLLKSIEVIDSSVSAKYGGFQGGVVNAKTRDPKKGFHGVVSGGYTSGDLSKNFIDPLVRDNYKNSTGWYDKSDFSKRKYRFGMEGYVSDDFGLLFDYTKHKSIIKTHTKDSIMDPKIAEFPNETRDAQNYFIKGIYRAGDRVNIKPSYLYSKQNSRSFIEHDLNSAMDNKFGGFALNLDVEADLDSVFLEQKVSYSEFESSRYFDFKNGLYDYAKSNLKNWGNSYNARDGLFHSYYGGLGDIKQLQKTFTYNIDATLSEFEIFNTKHNIINGFEYENKRGSYRTLTPFAEYFTPKALPDGYICDKDDLTCINDNSFGGKGQYLSELYYYGNVYNKATMNKFALYLEDEILYDKFKFRPGVRMERNSINSDVNIAPRFVSEYEFIGENFLGFGLNRYYGRELFAQKIYNDMYAHQEDFIRNHPNEKFTKTANDINGFLGNKFKTPYDDELSLFYRGDIKNARLDLKYIKRKSRDEVKVTSRKKAGLGSVAGLDDNYYIYTNDGKTDSDIYTFTVQNIDPIEFINTKNYFELGYTHMKRDRNFNKYTDSDLYLDRKILYNGKERTIGELPTVDFYTPDVLRLAHTMQVPYFGITLSNFINYESGNEALVRGFDKAKKMQTYTKVNLPSRTTWDARVAYDKNLHKDVEFFANFDINNILNKKQKIDADSIDDKIYYTYATGRNLYLEVGLKW